MIAAHQFQAKALHQAVAVQMSVQAVWAVMAVRAAVEASSLNSLKLQWLQQPQSYIDLKAAVKEVLEMRELY